MECEKNVKKIEEEAEEEEQEEKKLEFSSKNGLPFHNGRVIHLKEEALVAILTAKVNLPGSNVAITRGEMSMLNR